MQHLEQVPKTGEFIIIYIGQHGVREVSLFISQVNTDRNNDDGCSQLTCSQDITTHPQGESRTGVSATGVLQQGAGDCAEPTRRGSEARYGAHLTAPIAQAQGGGWAIGAGRAQRWVTEGQSERCELK